LEGFEVTDGFSAPGEVHTQRHQAVHAVVMGRYLPKNPLDIGGVLHTFEEWNAKLSR
jgi:hypothetical protein